MEAAARRRAFQRCSAKGWLRRSPRRAQVQRHAGQARGQLGSPLEYLGFEEAWIAIEAARAEAFATGVRVPPHRLDECDRNLVESALSAPQTAMQGVEKYPDLQSKAAALLYALAKSQACPDGNKRVALILVMEFLAMNGATLEGDPDALADMILEVAASDAVSRDEVLEQLTQDMRPLIVPLTLEEE